MRVEFLLEEESAEEALRILLPRLLPAHYTPKLRVFRGCQDLLKQLTTVLKGYKRRLEQPGQQDLRVVVLVDADDIAERRRQELEQAATEAGLLTYAQAAGQRPFYVVNTLAVQELEAWFLGDPLAIQTAYPRVRPQHFGGLPDNPDTVAEAWEALLRVLQKADPKATKAKVRWAETIAPHLDIERNSSPSFQYFRQCLASLE
ncbi:DUF4276 family protein [Hymenobacter edaphi]|uniref:DUF4276 family protein n=1 Tax=Hymenobacter edaphi TaxID=2211146 RepID=A0A328BMH5_9BACT|nr:DUF4276 family protein [Hymenobacter edaphi]RAK68333.1 hypothetical protein DLM85_09915 [Hymenobacter edaphi]